MIPFSESIIIAGYFEIERKGSHIHTLPFAHARNYPLGFDIVTKEIVSGEITFFNKPLFENFSPEKNLPSDKWLTTGTKLTENVIILNTLDNCYGHALLKLFYAAQYVSQHLHEYDFILILPKALQHLWKATEGVRLLVISLNFRELEKCVVLNEAISSLTREYRDVFIQETKLYDTYHATELQKNLNFFEDRATPGTPDKIIFYYRKDHWRKWAGYQQAKNIIALFSFLKHFFSVQTAFYVVGDRDDKKFPSWIKDERTDSFSSAIDFRYNKLFNESILCIGLTGSHMLFPSLLAECTAHLHPVFKYKNMAEDVVSSRHTNEILSAYRHLYYFGNHDCSDITPEKLGYLLLNHLCGLMEKKYKISDSLKSQDEWIANHYPLVNYKQMLEYRAGVLKEENKKTLRKFYISKFLRRLSGNR